MPEHVLVLVGIWPEATKLYPLIGRLIEDGAGVTVCATGQHHQFLVEAFALAEIVPDIDFDVMSANETFHGLTAQLVKDIGAALERVRQRRRNQNDSVGGVAPSRWSRHARTPARHAGKTCWRAHELRARRQNTAM